MTRWRIKEMSDLTRVSVRMLRHYDAIGLLKPSMRTSNNYRYYSESDLATLQQIIALRFFNFDLSQIRAILQQEIGIREHLSAQMVMLQHQAEHLANAQGAIKEVLKRLKDTERPDWNDLIALIEGYRVGEEIKKTWAAQALNEQQLEKYTALYKQYPKEFEAWEQLIVQINKMSLGEPEGVDGERVVMAFIDITKKTKQSLSEQRQLNADIMRSIKEGAIAHLPLSPEGNVWLAKAATSYWLKRWEALYQVIVKNLKADPEGDVGKKVAHSWRSLIDEQFMQSSPDLIIGIMMWQEAARQKVELQEQAVPASAQDMIKKIQVRLLFDSVALRWIEQALNTHPINKHK